LNNRLAPAGQHQLVPGQLIADTNEIGISTGLRVGTADREKCISQLSQAYADGFFPDEEYDRRITAAHGTYSRSALSKLLVDLPSTAPSKRNDLISRTRKFFKTDWGIATLFGAGVIASIIMAVAVPVTLLHGNLHPNAPTIIVAVLAPVFGFISATVNIVGVVTTLD
jgi:hypothetical protein